VNTISDDSCKLLPKGAAAAKNTCARKSRNCFRAARVSGALFRDKKRQHNGNLAQPNIVPRFPRTPVKLAQAREIEIANARIVVVKRIPSRASRQLFFRSVKRRCASPPGCRMTATWFHRHRETRHADRRGLLQAWRRSSSSADRYRAFVCAQRIASRSSRSSNELAREASFRS